MPARAAWSASAKALDPGSVLLQVPTKFHDAVPELMAQIAQLLELTGADKFRVIAIDRAARLIEGSAQDLVALGTAEGGREALLLFYLLFVVQISDVVVG